MTEPARDPDTEAAIARALAYRDREQRRAASALDRYMDLKFRDREDPVNASFEATDVAAERFAEAVGDYVLARICNAPHDRFSLDHEYGECSNPVAHQKAHYGVAEPPYVEYGENGSLVREYGRPAGVTDASAVHVPHRHLDESVACVRIDCHQLHGKPCTFCGGQPCRVVLNG